MSRRSFRFSRRKKACSGATSIASGWSMRVTRTSERIFVPDAVDDRRGQPAPSSRDQPAADAAGAAPTRAARRCGAPASPAPVARGSARRQQRQLVDQAHRLVELDRQRRDVGDARRPCTRSRSRAMARRTPLEARLVVAREPLVGLLQRGDQRLGAAGDRRLLHAPTRIAASMSASRFSSRERDSDWISSSSWPRCSATSATRASSSATLAAASRAPSCACLREQRASADLRLRCPAGAAPAPARAAHALLGAPGERRARRPRATPSSSAERPARRQRSAARRGTAGGAGGAGDDGARRRWRARQRRSRSHRLYAGDHGVERRAAPRAPRRSRARARARRCADASRARARAASRAPGAAPQPGGRSPRELLKATGAPPAGAARASSSAPLRRRRAAARARR